MKSVDIEFMHDTVAKLIRRAFERFTREADQQYVKRNELDEILRRSFEHERERQRVEQEREELNASGDRIKWETFPPPPPRTIEPHIHGREPNTGRLIT